MPTDLLVIALECSPQLTAQLIFSGLGPSFGYGKHIITLGYYEIISFEKVRLPIASKRAIPAFLARSVNSGSYGCRCSGQPRSFLHPQSLQLRCRFFFSTIEYSPGDGFEWQLSSSDGCKWHGSSVSHVRWSSPVPLLRTIGTKQSLGGIAPTLLP